MTQPNRPTPWPRTWPPFWRDVLHVAIAAGVGNVLSAAPRLLDGWLNLPSFLGTGKHHHMAWKVLHAVLESSPIGIVLLVPVFLVAFLGRTTLRIHVALLLALIIWWTAADFVELVIAPTIRTHGAPFPQRVVIWAIGAIVGSVLGGVVFADTAGRIGVRRVLTPCAVGGVLFFLASAWWWAMESAYGVFVNLFQRGIHHYEWYVYLFAHQVSMCAAHTVTFAITAKLLIRAAEGETNGEEESR